MFKLTPAHGKDYQTEEEVREAFKNNEEFFFCGPRGCEYCDRVKLERDFGRGFYVTVVYCDLTKVVKIEV